MAPRALFSLMLPNCALILAHTGMWMLSWLFRKAPSSQCVGWTSLSTGNWLDLHCILGSWVMANQLADMMICGLVGVLRYLHSFIKCFIVHAIWWLEKNANLLQHSQLIGIYSICRIYINASFKFLLDFDRHPTGTESLRFTWNEKSQFHD